jgi:hypothetical protein
LFAGGKPKRSHDAYRVVIVRNGAPRDGIVVIGKATYVSPQEHGNEKRFQSCVHVTCDPIDQEKYVVAVLPINAFFPANSIRCASRWYVLVWC